MEGEKRRDSSEKPAKKTRLQLLKPGTEPAEGWDGLFSAPLMRPGVSASFDQDPDETLPNHPSDFALMRGQEPFPSYLQLSIHLLIPFSSLCSFIPLRSPPPIRLRNNNVRPWRAALANVSRSSIPSGDPFDFAGIHLWAAVTCASNISSGSAAAARHSRTRRTQPGQPSHSHCSQQEGRAGVPSRSHPTSGSIFERNLLSDRLRRRTLMRNKQP